MSPDRLFAALKREVILNRPHEYKITALLDIKNLFPDGKHPFYAGFGNKVSDATAYRVSEHIIIRELMFWMGKYSSLTQMEK